jgi:hypothetical protein
MTMQRHDADTILVFVADAPVVRDVVVEVADEASHERCNSDTLVWVFRQPVDEPPLEERALPRSRT